MMNTGYLISQAERTPSRMEQRDIDTANAHLVASFVQLWQAVTAPLSTWTR